MKCVGTASRVNREEEGVMQRARRRKGEVPGSVRSHVRAKGSCLSACDPIAARPLDQYVALIEYDTDIQEDAAAYGPDVDDHYGMW